MKNIKLFNAFGIDKERFLSLRETVLSFLLGSGKWLYDEIHIPCEFENDEEINELIKEYNLNSKISYYNSNVQTMREIYKRGKLRDFDSVANVVDSELSLNDDDKHKAMAALSNSTKLIGALPSLKDVHNRMLLDRLTAQTEEIVKENSKPPKLEITHLGVNEDGALRIVIDAKEQNDPNTFLKVMRGLRKVLREHEEEIING